MLDHHHGSVGQSTHRLPRLFARFFQTQLELCPWVSQRAKRQGCLLEINGRQASNFGDCSEVGIKSKQPALESF